MSATVKNREMLRNNQVDDTHYDASEEESISDMDTIHLENALPILDAPRSQQRSLSEPTLKTKSGKRTLRPRPVITGYSTSDDEDIDSSGVVTRGKRKARVVIRYASWPYIPLTPKAQDSGVQGLDDSETDSGSTDGKMAMQSRRRKRTHVEGEIREIDKTFRGIAAQDSNEERWRKIVLEEHMDKIFKAVPNIPRDERGMKETVAMEHLARKSLDTDDWDAQHRTSSWKEAALRIVRFCACG
ncbi:hypothetical protein NA56DRAFT_414155 [Hyaloscypha hepaticicola]|uniref:Uncharacterized protein n=1 Tax=Hyaloscypha hepaticicola TaxID=2082293 RepID=A0A2J6PI44_9HELO|nr:hypothetical protein NA56DRAFT_414155 [Hyaloscypha hepaticicola]